ncbi:DUF4115 domain-containing protein [Planococcus sp. N028]|uniref:DUF4115 domain-containing protein n=1 Tax=Planococcus shixiaomingii TaxID=3058393 RepID=A0ABT8MZZ8_9BACL|nr:MULTISPECIES: RodZ domain-containing protein [unclassified Planococcus (in: firmicutes)]MDN7241221.1 DUF4115 domain-containing protein [Planococcus sp. N028]WKA53481.1 DUF4115 domain-containing protein [Planococcus sp. N022]
MSELGTRLKEARIAKGYSLDDLQSVTKIQKRYLTGIEEGNYSMMPGAFYVRAFIKQYAEAVGLNSDELLEQHKSEVPEKAKEDVRPIAASTPSRRQTFARSSSSGLGEVMPKIIVALFIVVILGVVWFFYQQLATNDPAEEVAEDGGVPYEEPANSGDEKAPATEEEPAEEEPAKEEEPAEEKPEVTLEEAGTEGATTTFIFTGPAERELKIEASGASWVSATDQNRKELMKPARNMQKGDSETVDLTDVSQVRVRIGSTPNVKLTLNDQLVEYKKNATNPQNIIIKFEDAE